MSLKLITPPAALAVSLDDVKANMRLDGTDQDGLITAYIEAATKVAEHETGRRFITQTWEAVFDVFPEYAIELGLPPVTSIVSVKYVDQQSVEQTLSPAAYVLDSDQWSHYALPVTTWPDTLCTANAVRVRFVTGYGATAAEVPANARAWIMLAVSQLYAGCALDGIQQSALLDDLRSIGDRRLRRMLRKNRP